MIVLAALLAATGFALVHLFTSKLRFLDVIPRSRWLSMAGGASVAYVFVYLLPNLGEGQQAITRALGEGRLFRKYEIYLVALVGLVTFHGLERLARLARRGAGGPGGGKNDPGRLLLWLQTSSFAIFNVLVGYLIIHPRRPGVAGLSLFFIAMALHFVVADHGLYTHHRAFYLQVGRWLLTTAVFLGWALGLATAISAVALAVLRAFLAGSVIHNVLKEELPEERESRFWAFAVGAIAYAAILLGV